MLHVNSAAFEYNVSMKKTLGLVVLALNASFVFATAPNVENMGSVRGILTDLRSKAAAQAAPAATPAKGGDWDPWNDVPVPPSSGVDFTTLIPVDYYGATDFPKDAGRPLTMEAALSGTDYDLLVDFSNPKPSIMIRNSTAYRECADCKPYDGRNYGRYQPYDYSTKDLQDVRAAVERSYEDWSSRYKEHPMTIGAEKVLQALDKAIQP